MAAQLRRFEVVTLVGEQRCNLSSETRSGLPRLVRCAAKNFANFFFHAAAVSLGPALKSGLHTLLEIADNQLSHIDIMISWRPLAESTNALPQFQCYSIARYPVK